jgi:hypothetical protein
MQLELQLVSGHQLMRLELNGNNLGVGVPHQLRQLDQVGTQAGKKLSNEL